ncbi:hypothetical protein KFE25_009371 [Diacronema lutheri]|uniref:Uncharacterized protein n=1 Tax=Diacronema lutheri TaxID=2081491 RepID=A0A8J5Y3L8_DIALT|nr:hypothetical protein KFE25_009371 [Diacronema lutheri]
MEVVVSPRPSEVRWLDAHGSRGSRAALWAWLRASGVNAPRARLCPADGDMTTRALAAVRALGPPPVVIRLQSDRGDASIGARSFLVAVAADIAPVIAYARALVRRGASDIVLSDDHANGRIGLMLHRCAPIAVQVLTSREHAVARHVQLLLDRSAAAADVDGPHPHCSRTQTLEQLVWQLGKVYASREPGPAGLFAPDEEWCKARWGCADGERVLRRAELAAWLVHAALLRGRGATAGGGGELYEVHLAFGFDPADGAPAHAEGASDLRELIVVDLRRLGTLPSPASSPGFAAALRGGGGSTCRRANRLVGPRCAMGGSEDGCEADAHGAQPT